MAEAKTTRTGQKVGDFIKGLADAGRQTDCAALVRIMTKAAGATGVVPLTGPPDLRLVTDPGE